MAAVSWALQPGGPAPSWAGDQQTPGEILRHKYPEPRLALPEPRLPPLGGVLVRTRGCLECHRVGEQGTQHGVGLYNVGRRLTAEDIGRRLADPKAADPAATMITPALTRAEALVIAEFLSRPR